MKDTITMIIIILVFILFFIILGIYIGVTYHINTIEVPDNIGYGSVGFVWGVIAHYWWNKFDF